jgi:hypothetical protein
MLSSRSAPSSRPPTATPSSARGVPRPARSSEARAAWAGSPSSRCPRASGESIWCAHRPPPTAHHPPPTAHRPPPTTHRPPPTAHRPPPTAHGPPPTAHRPPPTAHRPPPTAHRPPPTAHRPPQLHGSRALQLPPLWPKPVPPPLAQELASHYNADCTALQYLRDRLAGAHRSLVAEGTGARPLLAHTCAQFVPGACSFKLVTVASLTPQARSRTHGRAWLRSTRRASATPSSQRASTRQCWRCTASPPPPRCPGGPPSTRSGPRRPARAQRRRRRRRPRPRRALREARSRRRRSS